MYQDYILEDLEKHIKGRVRKLEKIIQERQQVEAWISALLSLGAIGAVVGVYYRMGRYFGKGFNMSSGRSSPS